MLLFCFLLFSFVVVVVVVVVVWQKCHDWNSLNELQVNQLRNHGDVNGNPSFQQLSIVLGSVFIPWYSNHSTYSNSARSYSRVNSI